VSALEQRLSEIGTQVAYPRTPDVAAAVAERVRAPRRRRHLSVGRTVAVAVAGLLLVSGAAFAFEPGLRHAVLDWLGLRSVRIERTPRLPTLPPGSAGRDLGLGRRTYLRDALARVSFHALLPRRPADEVYLANSPPGGQVAFVYRPRPGLPRAPGTATGLLITELRGSQPRGYLNKSLGPGTTISFVRVGADRGVWIAGRPHEFAYLDAHGQARYETLRLAGNTLLWNHRGVLVRLEANVTRQTAIEIASSLH
jgi:hypothetical protein